MRLNDDSEAPDQAEPLLRDPDTYSLSTLNEEEQDDRIPTRSRTNANKTRRFEHRITPILPHIQSYPLRVFEQYVPSRTGRLAVFSLAGILWTMYMVCLVVRAKTLPSIPGYGEPRRLTCYSNAFGNIVERYATPSCDTYTPECITSIPLPFAFQCPPDCASAHLQEEHYLGDQFVENKIWVIGGMGERPVYRADSYICGAALHAGIISNRDGGCGILTLSQGNGTYQGGRAHGITSMDFNSSYPLEFGIEKLQDQSAKCFDMVWMPFTVSVILTVCISLLTSSPSLFFAAMFTIIFFQTALITDSPNFEDTLQIVQVAFARFLPASFVAFAIYLFCARQTLTGLDAHLEKTVLWLGGCWFGAVDNYTLDRLPLSRLTPRDLAAPGAIIVLLCVVGAIILAAGTQAWAFWRDGRFWRYLTLYAAMGVAIVVLVLVPGLNLRIHHYILAMLLLPGTAIQTRPSLLFQGFLLGLFINGVARWGFASIIETTRFLAREGQLGSQLPDYLQPLIEGSNITFAFTSLSDAWDGISVQVNDVERTRMAGIGEELHFTWARQLQESTFFRFAYMKYGYIDGALVGDYTTPGTWNSNGSWTMGI